MNDFYIKNSDIHGFGCFANRDIEKGERFYFSVLPIDKPHNLGDHTFPFVGPLQSCLVLSDFTYCNSSNVPNMEVLSIDKTNRIIIFNSILEIKKDQEILLNYLRD